MERQKEAAASLDDQEEGVGGAKLPEPLLGLKLRRGLSFARRGGTCTPVCAWKLEEGVEGLSPSSADDCANASAGANQDRAHSQRNRCHRVSLSLPAAAPPTGSGATVSARKLGADLWEIQDLLRHRVGRMSSRTRRRKEEKLANLRADVSPLGHAEQVAASSQAISPAISLDLRGRSGYSHKMSTELLKVLNRIWSLEEKHTSTVSLVKTLKLELEHAQACIQELSQDRQSNHREIDRLMKQIMEDKRARKSMEQEKIKAASQSLREELEDERGLRRHSETLHRRLVKELSEIKSAFSKTVKDLEREKNAHNLLEDLCDEFAKGIREYEQEMRELKRKSEKGCGHRGNSLTLEFSGAWLDERLQIKFADSQGNLSEKNRIMDRLECEVGAFLQLRRSYSLNDDVLVQKDNTEDRCLRRHSLESIHLNGAVSAPQYVEDEDSVDSDVHCFELNMGSNATGRHDHLKLNGVQHVEKLEESRNYGATKKTVGSSERFEHQGSSIFPMKFEGHMQPCNEVKMEFMDKVPAISRHNMNEGGNGANQIDAILREKLEEDETREDIQGVEVKLDVRNLSDHIIDNSGIESELGEFCKSHPEGGDMDSCKDFLCQHYSLTVLGDDASSTQQALSSPLQRRGNHHMCPDLQISECSKLPQGIKRNSLKAKLLEARLKGQRAGPGTCRDSSVGAIGH